MNINAAFKTLLVVLGIGALTGFNEWQAVHGGTPKEKAKREIAHCIRDRQAEIYRASSGIASRSSEEKNQAAVVECRDKIEGDVPLLGVDATPGKNKTDYTVNTINTVSSVSRSKSMQSGTHAVAATSSKDLCLARLEEARKRSPGGLNPEWEQGERDRCEK